MPHVLGVDLGGTYLRVAVAAADGPPLTERVERLGAVSAAALSGRVRELVEELAPEGIAALGAGLPGPVDRRGRLGAVVNAPALTGAPIGALLAEELAVPVRVDNDVNLAALGEQRHGDAVGDLCFVAVGTGIGMGIVVDGQVVRGARGGAGELGLLPVAPRRVVPGPDELGPLEAIAAGAGLAARWRAHTGRPASGRDVYRAADAGDPAARTLIDEQVEALAMAIRAVEAMLDPELIVLGGGIGARDDVFNRLHDALATQPRPMPRLRRSVLGERAGVLGAIEAARDLARTPTPAVTGQEA
jgi:glucokinase